MTYRGKTEREIDKEVVLGFVQEKVVFKYYKDSSHILTDRT